VGLGARDFAHRANAAKPRKLSSPVANDAKLSFSREVKITLKLKKVDVLKPALAMPHGHDAFGRFGAETCAEKARKQLRLP